jgi:HlyD family secretion protein
MIRRHTRWGLWALGLGALLWLGCGDAIPPGNRPTPTPDAASLPVAEVRLTPRAIYFDAMGTVTAVSATTIASKVLGTVTTVAVREGDRFRIGDALVLIDPRQAQARLDQARAAVSQAAQARQAARAALERARAADALAAATLARYRLLQAEQTVSPQEFDEIAARGREAAAGRRQAEAMARAAQDQMRQTEAALQDARVMFHDTRVTAPFEGLVVKRLVEPGDLAMPGKALLAVEQSSGHQVEAAVPANLGGDLAPGQPLAVVLPAIKNQRLEATVATVEPAVDPTTRTLLVKLTLPAAPGLRSGMFVQVRVPIGQDTALWIPVAAVVHEGQLTGVYRVDAAGIARFRLIRFTETDEERVRVVAGLADGDRIVTAVSALLRDGLKVEARP